MDRRWLFLALLGCVSAGSLSMFGKIISPNYPQSYPNNANETWEIQLPEGYGIRLYFIHLDIDHSENCENDSVKVIVGDKVQQTLCDGHLVGSVGIPNDKKYYPTTHLKLVFKSDDSNHMRFTGFSAYYIAVDVDECEDDVQNPCSHSCHNYIGGYFCSCPQEYVLQSDQRICEVLSCEIPQTLPHGYYTFLSKPNRGMYQSSIIYNCTGPFYTMVTRTGSAKFTCSADGLWKDENGGHQRPVCVPAVDCKDPGKIENGAVTFTPGTYKSEIKYRCNTEYYTLNGDDTYHCSMEGTWINNNGESKLPECLPVCGISSLQRQSRIFGGSSAKDGNFPWVVHIESDMRGVGSLISDRWILTAATVVQNSLNPTIKLGSVRLGQAKEQQSKKVILHPKWIVEDLEHKINYDNDIALIQLSNKIELGPCVYPVCLPQKGGINSPAIREVGYVAGWGRTETQDRMRLLQYAKVVFRDTDECRKTVVTDQAFTKNMVCAGGSGKDSCAGDNGGPLMFEDLTDQTDNSKLYISGIVSWGIECGKFGMYTKVENYLDWIKETIEEVEKEEDEPNTEPVKVCPEKKA